MGGFHLIAAVCGAIASSVQCGLWLKDEQAGWTLFFVLLFVLFVADAMTLAIKKRLVA